MSSSDSPPSAPFVSSIDLPPDEDIKASGKNKRLASHHLEAFGFNDAIDDFAYTRKSQQPENGAGARTKAHKKKSRTHMVVYGDVDDDDEEIDRNNVSEWDDKGSEGETYEDTLEIEIGREDEDSTTEILEGEDEEDEWEDEWDEAEMGEEEWIAYKEARRMAEEAEAERLRALRVAQIMKKKEALIELYLKTARVMIRHRKKNIYLQDYLYHLAYRKGVLRGDTFSHGQQQHEPENEEAETSPRQSEHQLGADMEKENPSTTPSRLGQTEEGEDSQSPAFSSNQQNEEDGDGEGPSKTQDTTTALVPQTQLTRVPEKKEFHVKKSTAAMRFARFLRKTGHLAEDDKVEEHHLHLDPNRNLSRVQKLAIDSTRSKMKGRKGGRRRATQGQDSTSDSMSHNRQISFPSSSCRDGGTGTTTECQTDSRDSRVPKTVKEVKFPVKSRYYLQQKRSRKKLLTMQELMEKKSQTQLKRVLKDTDDALESIENLSKKLQKQKQVIHIADLLRRQYGGTNLMEKEKSHLVNFVKNSIAAQKRSKRKNLKKQQKNKSVAKPLGPVNLNHQWRKSLERIRELRLKKAELEQEKRVRLNKKMRQCDIWKQRKDVALQAVPGFIVKIASKVTMSRRETESFSYGLDQFKKQLQTLHEAVHVQLIRLFRAKSMLHMAQRKVKDNANVAAPAVKGFTIADFERMSIENYESHQKLLERQRHLLEQHDKLRNYMGRVATGHGNKQKYWTAIRGGRTDLEQLWKMCHQEKTSLMKSIKEFRKVEKAHKKLFIQAGVIEKKRIYKDYKSVFYRVRQLEDKKRDLLTKLHRNSGTLRVLNVKIDDTRLRINEERQKQQEQAEKEEMDFFKKYAKQRLNPRMPNTLYSINSMSRSSMYKILEPEIEKAILNTMAPQRKSKLGIVAEEMNRDKKLQFKSFAVSHMK